ncbi:RmlC-like cupin domain-containing protein [Halenospora varia]|nr:RmlC-like cupin domain-containing protein [Halenospora varia]
MTIIHLQPHFTVSPDKPESPQIQSLISALDLEPHIEGGFYTETDRSVETVPSPFPIQKSTTTDFVPQRPGFSPRVRNASTTIFYLLTPSGPQGGFHRNKARTVHTLHRGRGRYVIIHADEEGKEKRVESFVVGQDVEKGERLQWIVEGGKFKASFLLEDVEGGRESGGLLISETVVPGFEYCDHDFLSPEGLTELLGSEKAEQLSWLLSPLGKKK